MQKEAPVKKPEYRYAGKETLTEIIGRAFPRQLIPTKKMGEIFGGLFILTMILAIFQFPYGSLIAGETNISIGIGYPYPYFDFGLSDTDESPLRIPGLIIDMILYLILAYIIDVTATLIMKNPLISKEQAGIHPTTFKDQKKENLSDTITKKVFENKTTKPGK